MNILRIHQVGEKIAVHLDDISVAIQPPEGVLHPHGQVAARVALILEDPATEAGPVQPDMSLLEEYGRALWLYITYGLSPLHIERWLSARDPCVVVEGGGAIASLHWELLLPVSWEAGWFVLSGHVLRIHSSPARREGFTIRADSGMHTATLVTARPHLEQDVPLGAIAECFPAGKALSLVWHPFTSRTSLAELGRQIAAQGTPRFLHIDMHGVFESNVGGESFAHGLLLEGPRGGERVSVRDFFRLVPPGAGTCVVATSCRAVAAQPAHGEDASAAPDLPSEAIEAGAEWVIASSRRLRPAEAGCFVRAFYSAIERGASILTATRVGRAALHDAARVDAGGGAAPFSFSASSHWQALLHLGWDEEVFAGSRMRDSPIPPPVPVEVLSQFGAGGGRVTLQTTARTRADLLRSIEFWVPRLWGTPKLEHRVAGDRREPGQRADNAATVGCVDVYDITDPSQVVADWDCPALDAGVLEVVLTHASPEVFGGSTRTAGYLPVPLSAGARDFNGSAGHGAAGPDGSYLAEWLVRLSGPVPVISRPAQLTDALTQLTTADDDVDEIVRVFATNADGTAIPGWVRSVSTIRSRIDEVLRVLGDITMLSSFAVGLLLPPDHDGSGSVPLATFADLALKFGLAHSAHPGSPRLVVYGDELRREVLRRLAHAALRNQADAEDAWADAELRATAPDLQYEGRHILEMPGAALLRDRLLDFRASTGSATLYMQVNAANRLFHDALCAAVGYQPPEYWPDSGVWFGPYAAAVDAAAQCLSGLRPNPGEPQADDPGKFTVSLIGDRAPTEREEIIMTAMARSMIDLTQMTPLQHARMVLSSETDPGMTVHHADRTIETAMAMVAGVDGRGRAAPFLRTAERLSVGAAPEDVVHLYLEAAIWVPEAEAVPILNRALACALQDGSTHSVGHAVEILTRIAARRATANDLVGRDRSLEAATKVAVSRDPTRYQTNAVRLGEDLRRADHTLAGSFTAMLRSLFG